MRVIARSPRSSPGPRKRRSRTSGGSGWPRFFTVTEWGTIRRYWDGEWTNWPSTHRADLRGVWGAAGDDVYVVGEDGTCLHFDGTSWQSVWAGTSQNLYGIWGAADNEERLGRFAYWAPCLTVNSQSFALEYGPRLTAEESELNLRPLKLRTTVAFDGRSPRIVNCRSVR